ncbi:acetyltransferase [Spirosoma terrae]|uniref:Acetyltransferase n=1 Tax=Spirosoma terrae TaxID=1968276 RepID=A0A6L9L5C7_9BACT|nr:acetyltransferase [Spirosoma terrae]NDU95835.1 acetyltransferase [Spirosoma terrae]
MKKLIIYGTGSHAELVYAYFVKDSNYKVVAFTVEQAYYQQKEHFGLPVFCFEEIENHFSHQEAEMFIGVGPYYLNAVLEKLCIQSKAKGYQLANYRPSNNNTLFLPTFGENTFIDDASRFHPYVQFGNGVTSIDSQFGHHSKIGDYSFISAALIGGNVTIEDHVFIGMGSIVKSGVHIGKGSFIGMGCIINKDVEPHSVYSVQGTKKREGLDARKLRSF